MGATAAATARRVRSPAVAAIGPAALYIVVLLVVPFAYLADQSLHRNGAAGLSLANYAEVFGSCVEAGEVALHLGVPEEELEAEG